MNVIKRDNTIQGVDFNKITERIHIIINEQKLSIDPIIIAQKVCTSLSDNIKTTELDKLTAELAVSMSTIHPDYNILASHISVSDIHKNLKGKSFNDVINSLPNIDPKLKEYINDETVKKKIKDIIDYSKDYLFDYFAIKTLERAYLYKDSKGQTAERPQDLFMRVALGIHFDLNNLNSINDVIETYTYMSEKKFIHATPTLFNAGTTKQQLASCFLQDIGDDSISSIYKTLGDSAQISKYAGGIGLHIHNIRATGAEINKVPNMCKGILPMLKVFNDTAKYVCQSGKRPGSIAIYLQVDHADIFQFLDLKKNTGDEDDRARDLFYAAWIPDLFMQRVKEDSMWSLFCPHSAPGLADVYGEEYNTLYTKYEQEHRFKKQVKAQELWFAICTSQIETGTPYMLYKDAINKKSNQMNLGTIKSSNLCTEIVQFTSKEETAVCNLASICLPQFIQNNEFNFQELRKVAGILTKNLNKVIDRNFYPIPEAKSSNMKHRPIGIGVQGLADVYILLRMNFDSNEAKELNKKIFETIYIGAMEQSLELAKALNPYETFEGSPLSKGLFQFDLAGLNQSELFYQSEWQNLRNEIKEHGTRNSLLIAPMPTASTSQIMGNNECIEPYTSNIYLRRTMAGEFVVINKHLIDDLLELNLWTLQMKDAIIQHNGSVQNIPSIPDNLKALYKTAWEISQKVLIDQSADRQKFICQSQSLNLFVGKPTIQKLTSMHFYGWSKGLKTGMYYLRTQPAANPIQYTIDPVCESCSG